ncbi:Transcription factor AP-4 [Triplophysa tibetana]|uniref:Transcription factor AP-4 n=1 Tax=Triplophysa tibetana TaxID=1572043 RepID=A0A5A9NA38_9TELE|nr:Transcription factor AP-4 [Triplophysa tibetana]
MEYFMVPAQKVPSLQHFRKSEKEVIGGLCSLANIPLTPETARDQERRIRREIANSNERRRMQSINAGFQSLKTLIPHSDGEKLSKKEFSGSSPKRRRAEEKDEGIGSPDILEEEKVEDLRREMIELRQQLDKERSVRMMLEEQIRSLDAHLYPEKLKVIAQHVQEQQVQTQTLMRIQQQEQLGKDTAPARSPLMFSPATPPAPTHHATVIVPAPAPPPPSHHVTVVTMGNPTSVINTASTSRQNLDTIVQAIQHIEGTQERMVVPEEEKRRAVIVTPGRVLTDTADSDTASDNEGSPLPVICWSVKRNPCAEDRQRGSVLRALCRNAKSVVDGGGLCTYSRSPLLGWVPSRHAGAERVEIALPGLWSPGLDYADPDSSPFKSLVCLAALHWSIGKCNVSLSPN